MSSVLLAGALASAGCRPVSPGAQESTVAATAVKVGAVGEQDMGGLVALRDAFLKVETREQFDAFLKKVQADYATAPLEVRYVSAHLLLLVPFKSFIYRATPLLSKVKATHSVLLTVVQQVVSTVEIFFPTKQWQAFIQYVTQPDSPQTPVYRTLGDIQADAEANIIPLLEKTIQEIDAMAFDDAKPVVFDNRFFYGTASFRDPRDRFVKFGAAEKAADLAGLYKDLMSLRVFAAYDLDDMPDVAQNLGKIFGVDGFFFSEVKGSPIMARVEVLRKFPKFATLRQATGGLGDGKGLMAKALSDFRAGAEAAMRSWTATQARAKALGGQEDDYWFINTQRAMAGRRSTELALKDLQAIAQGPTQIMSAVTGETIEVNLPQFFTSPPADLKALMPTDFIRDEKLTVNGVTIRNYLWGSPTAWNVAAYQPYLPSVRDADDVKKVARILSQSWGGGGLLLSMSQFVN